ncbi:hypothetical protein JJL45_14885 [Tamlana sp. s12]|uniref:hypothetical protein n=1 Tax=Tamlana sp. s12 TaxID=1630406 RepID=UPI000801242C|nr:hypothetical protein [Tamlana sp. s12]OBQ54695.1 hypothetical protein VQ01_11150 [Tamlana sp. s12]QQY82191.1 hypothetical protein JJL45_14885 [Tamlana sp. s12]
MKRFLIISLICILSACASYSKKQGFTVINSEDSIINPFFSNLDKDYVYKAQIEVYDKVFGGLFIVKKTGSGSHRIVFTTEMGNKIFDFSFEKEVFKVNYILNDLDKKILINFLKKDFKVLVTEDIRSMKAYHSAEDKVHQTIIDNQDYYYFIGENLHKIVKVNHGKEKIVFEFSKIEDHVSKHILIEHLNIEFKMTLKSIN